MQISVAEVRIPLAGERAVVADCRRYKIGYSAPGQSAVIGGQCKRRYLIDGVNHAGADGVRFKQRSDHARGDALAGRERKRRAFENAVDDRHVTDKADD